VRLQTPAATALLALTFACQPEIVPEPYIPTDAYDAYRHGLEASGLGATALGRDWKLSGEMALRSPITVQSPFNESIYIDDSAAFAVGYRFAVGRGQRTEVTLQAAPDVDWRIYLDLFRVAEAADEPPIHVATGGQGDRKLSFEPRRDGEYVVRVQSELLRGGSVALRIENVPALAFPVDGRDTGSIGSTFGAPREGGRREHHGVDIFAPRHTPVLATSSARVRRVTDWKLGGHVVWLDDQERGVRLYFAHLQTQDVEEGMWVEPGDLIGTVGNSGNARTTPPHLHFGVYARGEGPIDPYPFLFRSRRRQRPVDVNLDNLGRWIRTKRQTVSILSEPSGNDAIRELEAYTPLLVWGGAGRRYRVALPDGTVGYVRERATESVAKPVEVMELASETAVLDRPAGDGIVKRVLPAGERIEVWAQFQDYSWVHSEAPAETEPEWVRPSTP